MLSIVIAFEKNTIEIAAESEYNIGNYYGGTIVFGIKDDETVVGVDNTSQSCLSIENKRNGSILPQPTYTIEVNEKNKTIKLFVMENRRYSLLC